MSSVTNTLDLLTHFSAKQPEIGLSSLCRMAGRDKATTYRYLQALEDKGFVEQNPNTKKYRLGPGLLQLAQVREVTVPRRLGADAALVKLCEATGETTHVSVLSGKTLFALTHRESTRHSTRVIIDIPTFPLHATASGLCTLAFGPADLIDVAAQDMQVFTPETLRTADALRRAVEDVQSTGFAHSNCSFEDDVYSVAAPVFDQSGSFGGAVSVASVASRFTPEHEHKIHLHLIEASRDITHHWGGTVPSEIEALWSRFTSHSRMSKAAS